MRGIIDAPLRFISASGRRSVIAWWALSRVVTLVAFAVLELLGPRGRLGHVFYAKPFQLLGAWDGVWYSRIAQHGYILVPGSQSDPAFFPLLPIMMRSAKDVADVPYVATGALLSNVALGVAVVGFYELTLRLFGDPVTARNAASFMAVAPMAFVFSMAYPESLALAFTVGAVLAAYADRWTMSAVLASFGVLARPEAIVLVVPLAARVWSRRRDLSAIAWGRACAVVVAAPAAVVSYPLYLKWSLHNGGAWGKAQTEWGRAFSLLGPWRALADLPAKLVHESVIGRDLGFFLAYVALVAFAARRGVPRSWIIGAGLILLLPLFSGSFESEARFGLLALPIYWAVALTTRRPRVQRAIRFGALALSSAFVIVWLPTLWP